jgi:Glycosyl hydrolase family 76.
MKSLRNISKTLLLFAVVGGMLTASGCKKEPVIPTTGTITGKVTDLDGTAVSGVGVTTSSDLSATTGTDGTYSIKDVTMASTTTLTFTKKGYLTTSATVKQSNFDATTYTATVNVSMMGGVSNGDVTYETVYGVKYRRHENTRDRVGPPYSYNSGTMLSGAACLYSATGEAQYLTDVKALTNATFTYFAKLGASKEGYYTYAVTDFNNWFNSVLMLGYADACSVYQGAEPCIASFQDNLDYGYDNYLRSETLPTNILVGWSLTSGNNQTEALTTFAYAAEYAVLAEYELEKGN